jgi:hypothetical protein
MDLGLRLAGEYTVAFRCGCLFASGDTTDVSGWRLCLEHLDLRPVVADAFGEADGECVVACRLRFQRV